MKISLALLAVALVVPPAAFAQTAGKAVGSFTPKSCGEPGRQLERTFQLELKGQAPVVLVYTGCSTEGRNDLLSGYTERYYEGKDGYGLTLVTEHGDGAYVTADQTKRSDVLVSKNGKWLSRLGTVANETLASGAPVAAQGLSVRAAKKAVPVVPQCEAKLPKPVYGPNELWMLTKTKAYYQREDCDICAELDSCDLATGAIKTVVTAHMVDCSDLAAASKGEDVLYSVCDGGR